MQKMKTKAQIDVDQIKGIAKTASPHVDQQGIASVLCQHNQRTSLRDSDF